MSISPLHIDSRCIHRESFLNEETIRSNKYHTSTPTGITYSVVNGRNVGVFAAGTNKVDTGGRWLGKDRNWSVSFWIYRTADTGRVIDQAGGDGYVTLSAGEISMSQNASQAITTTGTKVPNNTWVHIVATHTVSGAGATGIIYVNGVSAASGSIATARDLPTGNLTIGNNLAGNNGMTGYLSDLTFWDGNLTASEVSTLASNNSYVALPNTTTSQVLGSDLLAGWDFTNWTTYVAVDSKTANSFTTLGQGGLYKDLAVIAGVRYQITIAGTQTAGRTLLITNTAGTSGVALIGTITDASFSTSFTFTQQATLRIGFLNNASANTVTITSMTIQPITQESGSTLFDICACKGVIADKMGLRTITNTSTTVAQYGSNYVMDFNGTTSKLDTGADFLGTTDLTYFGWIYPRTYGESAAGSKRGRIVDNGKAIFRLTDQAAVGNTLGFSSDAVATNALAAVNAVVLSSWNFVCATRTTNGTTNLYIGNKNTAPVLSGTANQSSGTPVAGNTNVIIGNNNAGDSTFDGLIKNIVTKNKILTLAEITNLWSSTKQF